MSWPEDADDSVTPLHQLSDRPLVLANVLVPQVGVCVDEPLHQVNTPLIIDYLDEYAAGSQMFLGANEGPVFPDNDLGNLVEEDRP